EPIAAHTLEAPERREVVTSARHTSDEAAGKTQHLTFVEWHGRVRGERRHGDDVPAARTAHPGTHLHPAAAGALAIQRGGDRAAAVDDEQVAAAQVPADV